MGKMPYIIYAVPECLVKRIERCENNPEISSTTKVGQHTPCGYSMSTVWGFNHMKNKYTLYREKDCTKKFCKFLRERSIRIIGFEKKNMLPLTNRELNSLEIKIFEKLTIIATTQVNIEGRYPVFAI